jgi:hypothetical protein
MINSIRSPLFLQRYDRTTSTEGRAILGSNPSADPGAETKGAGLYSSDPLDRALSDQHQCVKPTVASRATVYLSTSAVTFTPNQDRMRSAA